MDFGNIFKTCLITIGGVFGCLLGGFGIGFQLLFILIIADYITGITGAAYQGKLNSRVAFWGIPRKLIPLIIVCVAHYIDRILGLNDMVRMATIFFYAFMEWISITENLALCNVPLPSFLTQLFERIKDSSLIDFDLDELIPKKEED